MTDRRTTRSRGARRSALLGGTAAEARRHCGGCARANAGRTRSTQESHAELLGMGRQPVHQKMSVDSVELFNKSQKLSSLSSSTRIRSSRNCARSRGRLCRGGAAGHRRHGADSRPGLHETGMRSRWTSLQQMGEPVRLFRHGGCGDARSLANRAFPANSLYLYPLLPRGLVR